MASISIGRRTLFKAGGLALAVVLREGVVQAQPWAAGRVAPMTLTSGSVPSQVAPAGSGWSVLSRPISRTPAMTRRWFRDRVLCGARTLHVSEAGSDSGDGSDSRPFREINRAVQLARPGDLISVGGGTYGYTEVRNFHGSPDRWLGIMSADDSVVPRISVTSTTDNFCNIISSSYVGLYGFEVCGTETNSNTNGSGISVYGNSHHVAIWQNSVHDFPGGGINCFDWQGSHDMIDISFNTISRTSKFSPNNTSGISIFAGQDLTAGATFDGRFGYTVVGNYIYDVECQVPYTAGGYPFVTDGNGISLDQLLTQHGYSKQVLVADNIITGCGGRAVLAYETTNVLMTNNVAIGNLRTDSPAINGGAELEGKTDGSVEIMDNVIFPINTPATVDGRSTFERNVFLSATTMDAGTAVARSITAAGAPVGFGYFAGPISAAMLRSSIPRARFEPASG